MDKSILTRLAEELKPYNYVVLRNWENLPYSVGAPGHEDLDLFVAINDYHRVLQITDNLNSDNQRKWIDVFTEGENYFPMYIERILTGLWKEHSSGFKIPTEEAAFVSLFYHDAVHKGGGKYTEKLRDLFLTWINPVKALDEGVGHYGDYRDYS